MRNTRLSIVEDVSKRKKSSYFNTDIWLDTTVTLTEADE